jgi:hypothetical protein
MRKLLGVILVILGATIFVEHGRQINHKIIIPKVLTYPTTTLEFSSKSPASVTVKFDNPNWVAAVSEARWVTTGGGTYFKLTCETSSIACMEATKGSGAYIYALTPTTSPAPRGYGRYSLIWDVNPPGDLVFDGAINVPEIDPTTGSAALALIAGAILIIRARRKK